jgi:hypothetical protein
MREYAAPACQDTKSQQLINEYFEIRHHRTHIVRAAKFSALNFVLDGHANATWSGVIGTVINQYTQRRLHKKKMDEKRFGKIIS